MRVLFYIREDYLKNIAGDTVQFLKTVEYVRKLGVEVTISHNTQEDLSSFDGVHLFNTIRVKDTYQFYLNARRQRKKIVLTPIFWNYIDYIPKKTDIEELYWREGDPLRYELFQKVDLIFPSGEMEMEEIKKRFNVIKPYKIIPNGVDIKFSQIDEGNRVEQQLPKEDFVLCVGRICPHKNQLSLARATRALNIPLVLVGPINQLRYYHECIKANPNLLYLSSVDHLQLVSIYQKAKVHALVSWYEIPGLVNLEAGLAGCNIVTTGEGSTREYFKDYVEYVNPKNLEEIILKVNEAMNKNKTKELSQYIVENFLWDGIAKKILMGYKGIF